MKVLYRLNSELVYDWLDYLFYMQVGLILMFHMLDFDQLIVGRSCPQNSWTNEVERVMSNLNYALYGMCFTRLPMHVQTRVSHSASTNEEPGENEIEWLEQRWR